MKTTPLHRSRQPHQLEVRWLERSWDARIQFAVSHPDRCDRVNHNFKRRPMTSRPRRFFHGFTLIELLIVTAIIGILMSMLLSALAAVKQKEKRTRAGLEMKAIETALTFYYGHYSRFPQPANTMVSDFTFGTGNIGTPGPNQSDNSALMAILLNEDRLSNVGHVKNPQGIVCLNPVTRAFSTNVPGLGPDLVYRDPWGNPYIITIDYGYDSRCRDSFYQLAAVSQSSGDSGYHGLYRTPPSIGDSFELGSAIMIWSLGPDGKADPNQPAIKDVNKDNILNWSN